MKRYIIATAFMLAALTGHAANVVVDLKVVKVMLPLSQADAVYVYDLSEDDADKQSRWGVETPLLTFPVKTGRGRVLPVTITGGVTTDTVRKGEPFLGLHVPVVRVLQESVNIGLAGGRRFSENEWMVGFKASRPIFGGE